MRLAVDRPRRCGRPPAAPCDRIASNASRSAQLADRPTARDAVSSSAARRHRVAIRFAPAGVFRCLPSIEPMRRRSAHSETSRVTFPCALSAFIDPMLGWAAEDACWREPSRAMRRTPWLETASLAGGRLRAERSGSHCGRGRRAIDSVSRIVELLRRSRRLPPPTAVSTT